MQLNNIHIFTAQLVLETGLHIGAGDGEIRIGGIDNTVIKHPVTDEPYIPGSSLKGKIRSLLEWKSGAVQEAPLGKKDYEKFPDKQEAILHILQLFGISGDTQDEQFQKRIGHTRLAFRDCALDDEYIKKIRSNNQSFTEAKSENRINRIAGTAEHPRQTERVPAGAVFKFRLSMKEFAGDDFTALKNTILQGLKLLEWDSLGGSGSRGYGKVKFDELKLDEQDISAEFKQLKPFG